MKHRNFILVFGAVASVASGAWLHVVTVKSYSDQLQRLRAETVTLDSINEQSTVPQCLNEIRQYLAVHAVDDSGPGRVADMLAVLARDLDKLGAQDRSWNVGASVIVDSFQEVPVNISFTGTLALTQDLLKRIDAYPGIARVERLTIRRDPARPSNNVSIAIRLQAVSRLQTAHASQEAS